VAAQARVVTDQKKFTGTATASIGMRMALASSRPGTSIDRRMPVSIAGGAKPAQRQDGAERDGADEEQRHREARPAA
jgi:hypothetical protein